jgi:hypothetical protein
LPDRAVAAEDGNADPDVVVRARNGDACGMMDYLAAGALFIFIILVLVLLRRRERRG